MTCIAYAQLIAENAVITDQPSPIVDAIFELLVTDLSTLALSIASLPLFQGPCRRLIDRLITVPLNAGIGWDEISETVASQFQ
ncbi:MAG TPA: hypothetical protein VIM11_17715 [Tepidisphaeraceae bacterium]